MDRETNGQIKQRTEKPSNREPKGRDTKGQISHRADRPNDRQIPQNRETNGKPNQRIYQQREGQRNRTERGLGERNEPWVARGSAT